MRFAPLCALAANLLLAGCFSSDKPLYGDQKPVTPLHGGTVDVLDLVHPNGHKSARLELGGDGIYSLIGAGQTPEEITRFRLYPLDTLLVAETSAGCKKGADLCRPEPGYEYVLVRVMKGRVEWSAPDCSLVLSKLSGIKVKADPCQFYDRAALEKALRVAAAQPWKAGGAYILH